MIVAQVLTDQHTDDPPQAGPLLDQVEEKIGKVTADGAYGDNIEVVIPPRSTAVPSTGSNPQSQRDRHLEMINTQGRLAWQTTTGYGQRALVETTMGRYKSLIGPRLWARGFKAQQAEAAIGVQVLNRMTEIFQQLRHKPSGLWIFSLGGVCIPSQTAPCKPRPSGRGTTLLPP